MQAMELHALVLGLLYRPQTHEITLLDLPYTIIATGLELDMIFMYLYYYT